MFPISTHRAPSQASNHSTEMQNPAAEASLDEQEANEHSSQSSSPDRGNTGDSIEISNRSERGEMQQADELPPAYGLHERDEPYNPPPDENNQQRKFEAWLEQSYQQFARRHPRSAHNEEDFEQFLENRLRHATAQDDTPVRRSSNRFQSHRLNPFGNSSHDSTDNGLPTLYGFPVLGSSSGFSRDLYAETLADDNPFSRGLNAMQSGHNHRRQPVARPSVGTRRPERRNPPRSVTLDSMQHGYRQTTGIEGQDEHEAPPLPEHMLPRDLHSELGRSSLQTHRHPHNH